MNSKFSLVFLVFGASTGCHLGSMAELDRSHVASTDLENFNGSVVCDGSEILVIKGQSKEAAVQDISAAVQSAQSRGLPVKVTSSLTPHSYNPGLCPEEPSLILDIGALNFIEPVENSEGQFDVGPGLRLNDLQNHLKKVDRAFPITPDFSGVTVAGAAATGSHHSSLKIPSSVADWVTQMQIVDGNGSLRTLAGPDLDLARVHLGLLGVVVSLRLQTIAQKHLEYRLARVGGAGSQELANYIQEVLPGLEYGRIRWFPSQQLFLADEFRETDETGTAYDQAWNLLPPLVAEANEDLIRGAIQLSATQALTSIPANALNFSRRGACLIGRLRSATFAGTIKAVQGKKVGLLSDMISSSCTEPNCPWTLGLNSRTLEVAFPLRHFEEWSAMVEEYVQTTGVCFPGNGVYLRFSAASGAALGQSFGEASVLAEIHLATGARPEIEAHSDVYEEIMRETVRRFQGRLHWAKNSMPYFLEAGLKSYPQAKNFVELKQEFDPDGLFSNRLWKQVFSAENGGVSPFSQLAGCGVDRSCFCQVGEAVNTCGQGGVCEPGALNSSIGVCRLSRW
jgi:L-gulonolactone oxidase